jgi:hypothetical protein
MKRICFICMWTAPAIPAFAAGGAATATGPESAAIPLSTGWVEGFLLLIVWLFVAAVVIGPLITFFNLAPKSQQQFIDDKKIRY